MCRQCDKINEQLCRCKTLAALTADAQVLARIHDLIQELNSNKAALHSERVGSSGRAIS
jgi:DTW domain-containing protein YfiP